jgi:O-antigen biosynthesis protein
VARRFLNRFPLLHTTGLIDVDHAGAVAAPQPEPPATVARPIARGKFLYVEDAKFYVRGVTYGTFRPRTDGTEVPEPDVVERDFALMAEQGINTVRVYSVPPRWLLDAALRHGLRVMVGIPVERHIGFLADRQRQTPDPMTLVREAVCASADHPAVLCYSLGNEIPASTARWFGARRIERFLERLYRAAKEEAPDSLVTYVNYPSTEYLRLDFLDLVCFNVYLESQERLQAYLARLHTLAGERPLVISELGRDGGRNGEDHRARTLDWQVRTAFASGCAGAFVSAWTDEWHRDGADVDDWDFGLTRRDRSPKPALRTVRQAFNEVPFSRALPWPRVSVVVCSYNGGRTIRRTLEGLAAIEYPDFEVIVVDDGSTDDTPSIARQYDVRLIRTPNRGLSSARNTGWRAATGEIVAYVDDDAWPDPHWLHYLAATFLDSPYAAVGGPNIAPPGDGPISECVANAPGGPVHVLVTDREAEHIPGCNMAFRRSCLEAIGGFDEQFRVAGDDVDLCWRLQERGWTIGFHPAAMVWHRRRNSVRTYWRQQIGYGRAEAMLERKWPEKYNGPGYVRWAGRLYGPGLTQALRLRRRRIYHGIWGIAPYQSVYEPAPTVLGALPQMPDWLLVMAILGGISLLGFAWPPLRFALPLFILLALVSVVQAAASAARATFPYAPRRPGSRWARRLITGILHFVQPVARLRGRLKEGLTPWRCRGTLQPTPVWPVTKLLWCPGWRAADAHIRAIEETLRNSGACVLRGGVHDRWDLEARGGFLGVARMLLSFEDHDRAQLVRLRFWPRIPWHGPVLSVGVGALAVAAFHDGVFGVAAVLGLAALLPLLKAVEESAVAMATIANAVRCYCPNGALAPEPRP